jgi:hypothetical protein
MRYAIAVLRHAKQPDIKCLEMPQFYRSMKELAVPHALLFEDVSKALQIKNELDISPYIAEEDEYTKPDFYVVNHVVADYIRTARFGNEDAYEWKRCFCEKNNGAPCRECFICMRFRILSDRRFIITHCEVEKEGVKT